MRLVLPKRLLHWWNLERQVGYLVGSGSPHIAVEMLYDKYRPMVQRWFAQRVWRAEHVEELTQDVFVEMAAHLEEIVKGHRLRKTWAHWLRAVARKRLCDYLAAHASHQAGQKALEAEPELAAPQEAAPPDTQLDDLSRPLRIRQACEMLDTGERKVVDLRFFQGLSWGDTARRMKKTEAAVRMIFNRCARRLERFLRRLGIDETDA